MNSREKFSVKTAVYCTSTSGKRIARGVSNAGAPLFVKAGRPDNSELIAA